MKITLITTCHNAAGTLATAMESVLDQKGVEVEYLVIDAASTDETIGVVKSFEPRFDAVPNMSLKWVSESDKGMYDGINKGIKMSTGDVIGILNADDVLASQDTLSHLAAAFKPGIEAVYADIRFVNDNEGTLGDLRKAKNRRYCSARNWRPWMFRFGAMVPHPSFYVRRECFERLGGYSLDYRICSDFELELRFLGMAKLRRAYLPECVVVMRMGGASTAGWRSNVVINLEDLRALRSHGIWSCLPLIYLKYLFKVWGFVFRKR